MICKGAFRLVCDEQAQATVEMAVVAPVLLVLALITYNLMVFLAASARFDRVAPDVVIAHAVSPSGETGDFEGGTVDVVQSKLEAAMEGYDLEVEVSREGGDEGASTAVLSLVGSTVTYRCSFRMKPWPQGLSIAGVSMGAPVELTHARLVTIDPWRPGVVM